MIRPPPSCGVPEPSPGTGSGPASTPGGVEIKERRGWWACAGHDVGATGAATAYRRLIGTGIAAVSEEAFGILSGDAVESGSECLLQRLDGTRGDPAQVDFHLGPSGFDRAQVRAVGGQIAISEA